MKPSGKIENEGDKNDGHADGADEDGEGHGGKVVVQDGNCKRSEAEGIDCFAARLLAMTGGVRGVA